jgi:predicted aldo/keto reductase-like oxidoreductase
LSALETTAGPGTDLNPSRIGFGTRAIGGWRSDDASEAELIRTIQAALDRGVALIDTAPDRLVPSRDSIANSHAHLSGSK